MTGAAIALVTALGLGSVCATRDAVAADAGAGPSLPACVQVTTDSRYVPYGYNHVVVLRNGCSRTAVCRVATDVNPEPQSVTVPASTALEVTTFMGSPSATFVAHVTCKL